VIHAQTVTCLSPVAVCQKFVTAYVHSSTVQTWPSLASLLIPQYAGLLLAISFIELYLKHMFARFTFRTIKSPPPECNPLFGSFLAFLLLCLFHCFFSLLFLDFYGLGLMTFILSFHIYSFFSFCAPSFSFLYYMLPSLFVSIFLVFPYIFLHFSISFCTSLSVISNFKDCCVFVCSIETTGLHLTLKIYLWDIFVCRKL
jgi:hypothetical protein